jgi:hypothetical protein
VSQPTPPSPPSSSASAQATVLRPEPSRLLAAWWAAVHALALASLPLIDWPKGCAIAAAAAVIGHAAVRRPRPPPRLLIYRGDGQVDWPEAGLAGLEIADGTRFTGRWVCLELRAPGAARPRRVLLIVDQLDFATWRTLLARLGRTRLVPRSAPVRRNGSPDLR